MVRREDAESLNGHRGGIVWFTGLSGSGKTTLSRQVEQILFDNGYKCIVIDGDLLRGGLNQDLGFSAEDRQENMRRAAEVADMFLHAGFIVLLPMISPSSEARDLVRLRFDSSDFSEVYVKCSLAACEKRDSKGLYRKARNEELLHFTGIDSPYEAPLHPEIVVDTEIKSIEDCAQELVTYIMSKYKLLLRSESDYREVRKEGEEHI